MVDLLACNLFDGMQGSAAGTGDGAAAGGEALSVFVECGHCGAQLPDFSVLLLSVPDLFSGLVSGEFGRVPLRLPRGSARTPHHLAVPFSFGVA